MKRTLTALLLVAILLPGCGGGEDADERRRVRCWLPN